MVVQLKSYKTEFLKVELTHPDNAIGSQITPTCIRLNRTRTGLSILCMINSPCSVFDPELEPHKFVEESREENINPVSKRGSMHQICTKSKVQIQNVQRCKVVHVFTVKHGFREPFADLFVASLANRKKVQYQPAERGTLPLTVAEPDNNLTLPQHLYTGTRTVVQLNGLIEL